MMYAVETLSGDMIFLASIMTIRTGFQAIWMAVMLALLTVQAFK
jgi:hypothetical protein